MQWKNHLLNIACVDSAARPCFKTYFFEMERSWYSVPGQATVDLMDWDH